MRVQAFDPCHGCSDTTTGICIHSMTLKEARGWSSEKEINSALVLDPSEHGISEHVGLELFDAYDFAAAVKEECGTNVPMEIFWGYDRLEDWLSVHAIQVFQKMFGMAEERERKRGENE